VREGGTVIDSETQYRAGSTHSSNESYSSKRGDSARQMYSDGVLEERQKDDIARWVLARNTAIANSNKQQMISGSSEVPEANSSDAEAGKGDARSDDSDKEDEEDLKARKGGDYNPSSREVVEHMRSILITKNMPRKDDQKAPGGASRSVSVGSTFRTKGTWVEEYVDEDVEEMYKYYIWSLLHESISQYRYLGILGCGIGGLETARDLLSGYDFNAGGDVRVTLPIMLKTIMRCLLWGYTLAVFTLPLANSVDMFRGARRLTTVVSLIVVIFSWGTSDAASLLRMMILTYFGTSMAQHFRDHVVAIFLYACVRIANIVYDTWLMCQVI